MNDIGDPFALKRLAIVVCLHVQGDMFLLWATLFSIKHFAFEVRVAVLVPALTVQGLSLDMESEVSALVAVQVSFLTWCQL